MLSRMGQNKQQFLKSSQLTPPELLQALSAFSSERCTVEVKTTREDLLFLILLEL